MNDGIFIYYKIQFEDSLGMWRDADLGHFFFRHMSWRNKGLQAADEIRKLIRRQNDFWQKSGIHAFEDHDDAVKVLELLIERVPDETWRLVGVWTAKRTTSILERKATVVP